MLLYRIFCAALSALPVDLCICQLADCVRSTLFRSSRGGNRVVPLYRAISMKTLQSGVNRHTCHRQDITSERYSYDVFSRMTEAIDFANREDNHPALSQGTSVTEQVCMNTLPLPPPPPCPAAM